METVKEFFIDNKCYYRLQRDVKHGLKAIIKAGYMHITNWYDDDTDVEMILNHAVTELKFRAKVATDLTICKIEKLKTLIENRNQTKLDL